VFRAGFPQQPVAGIGAVEPLAVLLEQGFKVPALAGVGSPVYLALYKAADKDKGGLVA
jgi:hypothetical protein